MFDGLLLAEIWPFTSSLMLWWAAAAVVPVLMHFWNRQRYQTTDWAASRFLHAAVTKRSNFAQLRRWLLLALRVLILLVFSTALANPSFIHEYSQGNAPLASSSTHTVLVLDDSYSMACDNPSGTAFSQAQQAGQDLVAAGRQGDAFTLIAMSGDGRRVIRDPAFDSAAVIRELEDLSISHGVATLAPVLDAVEKSIAAARRRFPRLANTRVCFFTDLGYNTWHVAAEATVRERLRRIRTKAALFLMDVGHSAVPNLAVVGIRQLQTLATTRIPVDFLVEIRNFAETDSRGETLSIWIDGQLVGTPEFEVAAGASTTVRFRHLLHTAGEHMIKVQLPADGLLLDNQCWRCITLQESINVLCVSGKSGAGRNIALALEPRDNDRMVLVELALEHDLLERSLEEFEAVFLCNVGRIDADEASVLGRFVQRGGGLAVFLGDLVQPESYNASSGPGGTTSYLPGKLGELVKPQEAKGGFFLDPLDYEHPIAETFRDVPGSGLFQIPTYRYVRLQLSEDDQTEVIFRFAGSRDPALVERPFGKGRCLLFTSAASLASVDRGHTPQLPWTVLPTAGDFVSLVQEMLNRLVRGKSAGRNLRVGEPLLGEFAVASENRVCQLFLPSGTRRLVQGRPQAEDPTRVTWSFTGTTHAGVYRAEPFPEDSGAQLFAVNLNTRTGESALDRVSQRELPESLRYDVHQVATETPPIAVFPDREFGWHLLILVVLLLLLECWLAGRRPGNGVRLT